MLSFDLSDEDKLILQTVREFCQREVGPTAKARDEKGAFPRREMMLMAELGLLGPLTPPEYGGADLSTRTYALIMEEISRWDASVGVTYNQLLADRTLRAGEKLLLGSAAAGFGIVMVLGEWVAGAAS